MSELRNHQKNASTSGEDLATETLSVEIRYMMSQDLQNCAAGKKILLVNSHKP
jgi:hypothetical protein